MPLNVLSFNLRCAGAADGANAWEARRSLALERIRAADPDLIGLQECEDNHQAAFVRQNLPDYAFYGVHRSADPGSGLEMTPVLYRLSAYRLLEQGCFWLSAAPALPGSRDWGAAFARTVVWVRLQQTRAPFAELVFFNTHFDYATALARLRSAQLLQRQMAGLAQGKPCLLTGDFNAAKDSGAYRALCTPRRPGRPVPFLHDALRQAGVSGPTFHDFARLAPRAAADAGPNEIDWILASAHFTCPAAVIDHTHQGEVWPSDHYPLSARLEF